MKTFIADGKDGTVHIIVEPNKVRIAYHPKNPGHDSLYKEIEIGGMRENKS